MPKDDLYVLERGFDSSIDPPHCYVVYYDGKTPTFVLVCEREHVAQLSPDDGGVASLSHYCDGYQWDAEVQLEGWPINYGFKAKK